MSNLREFIFKRFKSFHARIRDRPVPSFKYLISISITRQKGTKKLVDFPKVKKEGTRPGMSSEAAEASSPPSPAVARSVTSAMSMSMTDLWLHLRTSVLLYTVVYLSTCFLVGLTSVAFHVFVVGALICVISFFRLFPVKWYLWVMSMQNELQVLFF